MLRLVFGDAEEGTSPAMCKVPHERILRTDTFLTRKTGIRSMITRTETNVPRRLPTIIHYYLPPEHHVAN